MHKLADRFFYTSAIFDSTDFGGLLFCKILLKHNNRGLY